MRGGRVKRRRPGLRSTGAVGNAAPTTPDAARLAHVFAVGLADVFAVGLAHGFAVGLAHGSTIRLAHARRSPRTG